jgi:beta-glucosidase
MYLDDKLLFDSWNNQKFIIAQTSMNLSAGPHKIVVEHHNGVNRRPPLVRLGIVPQHEWVDPVAEDLAANADVAVLAVGFSPTSETEGWDRTFELPPGENELIQRIAAKNKHTIVVVTSGGGVDMLPWIDPGVIEAWYPGQEGGTALAEILLGEVNPSGHLAATFERRLQDNPAYANYYPEPGTNRIVYKEGVFVGYRGYEFNHVKPLFPFGYGLSYTTFKYSNLTADEHGVSFDVTNTGSRAGDAVPQVYIGHFMTNEPGTADVFQGTVRPPKELKGFSRVTLQRGETKTIKVPLNLRSFSYYDANGKDWRAEHGTYQVLVGSSSEQIELTGKISLAQDETEK